jgi:hypothetical protein
MLIPYFRLSALVAPFLALAVLNGEAEAAAITTTATTTKTPLCIQACKTPAECATAFAKWTTVDTVPIRLSHEAAVKDGPHRDPYEKKSWWTEVKAPLKTTWWGGHVLQDGSMNQWTRSDAKANVLYAYKYNADVDSLYYWQDEGGDCAAPAKAFTEFGMLNSVTILMDGSAAQTPPPVPSTPLPKCVLACVETAATSCTALNSPALYEAVTNGDATDSTVGSAQSSLKGKSWELKAAAATVYSGFVAMDGSMELQSTGAKDVTYVYKFDLQGSATRYYWIQGGDHCRSEADVFPKDVVNKVKNVAVLKKIQK